MLSYMGFEAFDPTNMYQYSTAYESIGGIYDAYDYGAFDYVTEMFQYWRRWSSLEQTVLILNMLLAFTGVENFTTEAILADYGNESDDYEKSTYWASYQFDKLLLAAEVAEAAILLPILNWTVF